MKKTFLFVLLSVMAFGAMAQRKSVSILGDSYSTYQGFLQPDTNFVWYFEPLNPELTDVNNVRQTWWHKFISDNGYKFDTNNSFSGATISSSGYNNEDYSDRSFVTRARFLGNPDIILVCGATNDSWANSPIGEYKYSGWTVEDLKDFRPSVAAMFNTLQEHYPNAEIYFILNDILKPEINESIETVAAYYGVPVIHLHDIDKIHGHPSIKGMASIAAQVAEVVK